MEETVGKGAILKEETPEMFVNGKDTVAVGYIEKLKGHGGGALHGV